LSPWRCVGGCGFSNSCYAMEQLAVSPMGEILNTPTFRLCIHVVVELDEPVDISDAKKTICELLLSQSPRFSSIPIMKDNGVVQWKKTEVNVDDHVFVPQFPPHLTSYDEYVEEYVSDMHLRKLSPSRPLWEFHFLNYKTTNGEAIMIVNVHHMLGDGASLVALARACSTRPSHNPTLSQTLISSTSHHTELPAQVHKIRSLDTTWFGFDGIYRLWNLVFTVVLVMWYTLLDLISTFSRFKWVEDSRFPIRGHPGVEMLPKVIASNKFKLHDIREIKNRVGGTVNDVVMGVVFYGFRLYCQMDLPVSPMGEILNTPTFGLCIHVVVELDEPVDISDAKKTICELLLSQSPRFSSIPIMKDNGVVQWKKTEVNVDDHVFVPQFPPHLTSYDEYVEEYVSDMHLRKLSPSRPLWEFHFLNYKTTNGEAIMIVNVHHMLGDGASLVALARACSTRPSHNPTLSQTLISSTSHHTELPAQVHKIRSLDTTWFGFD
ncbi:hypothetical protein KI387_003160, partial [Taxus chinensis]